ncbi:MAG: phosphopantetheine-binding protein [Fimbriimonadales bacterium]
MIQFLAKTLQRDVASFSVSDRLDDLMIDSLDLVELIMGLEDELGVDPPEKDIRTVGDLIEMVRRSRGGDQP